MSTTITKRPASTSQASGISLVGGAGTLHATLTDDDDATYAVCTDGCYGLVFFAGAALPSGSLPQYVVLRMRIHAASPPIVLYATVGGQQNLRFVPPPSGITTVASAPQGNYTASQLNGGMMLEFLADAGTLNLYESYLDITYVDAPVVNVTDPTGTIGVTQPTVQWTFVGDHPQSRFQVKVFTSAQYGASGFDPNSAAAFYDSGEQLGATRQFVPVENLANGETYRFYVRAAQLVGSITQWSAWDYSSPTVSVTPPPVPTLVVHANNATARIKIRVADTGTPTWQAVTVQRTTDGDTWENVRSANHAPVFAPHFVIYDYETGNSQPAQYRAQAIIGNVAGDIASAWSTVSAPAAWTSDDTWLKSPTQPTLNALVQINQIPTLRRRIPRGVFDVAGRKDPVVVSDARRLVEGTVTFACVDLAAVTALQTLLDLAEPLLLQTPDSDGFGSRYIACGDEDENRVVTLAAEPGRYVDVPFNEVLAPVGDVTTFGTTWADVIGAYATWADVIAAQATWGRLVAAQL